MKVSNKTPVIPAVEGTSVMPRQRPKGNTSAPLTLNNIPLTISPSPTTVKKSQSPVIPPDNQYQSFAQKPPLQNPPSQSQNYPSNPNFSAGYPSSTTPTFTAPTVFQNPQQFYPSSSQEASEKNLENLFQSSVYPDPFRDDGNIKTEFDSRSTVAQGEPQVSVNLISPNTPERMLVGSNNINNQCLLGTHIKQGLVESTSQCVVSSSDTPPSSPSLSAPKGHRRNMSDTTAFNK